MEVFKRMEQYNYEQLNYFYDEVSGLKAITCIHDTTLGPALGGTRFWNYATEDEAVHDVLRLAQGMTYKSACAGLNLGGGKTVIIGDVNVLNNDSVKREAFWRSFGRYVQGLNGRYITAEDVNTTTSDMDYINMETDFVTGLDGKSGNPSPFTALGTFRAIEACCLEVYGDRSVSGKVVAVQGLGAVGRDICKYLHDAGASLIVTDINEDRIKEMVDKYNAKPVGLDEIYDVECDIYAPNALGATINDNTIDRLKCKIIAGCANNVLDVPEIHGQKVFDKGMVYAPDYVANAGGIINVFEELNPNGYNVVTATKQVDKIYDRVVEILRISRETKRPTHLIANEMAEKRIDYIKNVKAKYNR